MTFKLQNIILLIIFFVFNFAFSADLNIISNLKPKTINSKKYVTLTALQKALPNSEINNKYTLTFNQFKIKVYPSSFYLLLESTNSSVFQFNYPVIMIDNELLLPYDQTLNIVNDLIIEINSKKNIVKSKEKEIKKDEPKPESKKVAKNSPKENNTVSKSENKSMIRMNDKEIPLDIPDNNHSENKSKNNQNSGDYFDKSIDEIAPIIDETFDYLILDGSQELRQILKKKNDSTNESFSPDSYRIPKNLKRKLK